MLSFHFRDKKKFRSNRWKTMLLRSKNDTYSTSDELPGELFEKQTSFFDVDAEREVHRAGELFKGEVIQGNR